jgi:hypothetical protein
MKHFTMALYRCDSRFACRRAVPAFMLLRILTRAIVPTGTMDCARQAACVSREDAGLQKEKALFENQAKGVKQ